MSTFTHDLIDPGANWCPNCGEMHGICQCSDEDMNRWAYDELYGDEDWDQDELRERVECKFCGGDGMYDDSTPCPHCDGEGFEWWLD